MAQKLDNKWKFSIHLFSDCSNPSEKGHKGINAFIVEKDFEGFVVGQKKTSLE